MQIDINNIQIDLERCVPRYTEFDKTALVVFRKQLRLSQDKLAHILCCTPTTIRNWETNRTVPMGYLLFRLMCLCEMYRIPFPQFYKRKAV